MMGRVSDVRTGFDTGVTVRLLENLLILRETVILIMRMAATKDLRVAVSRQDRSADVISGRPSCGRGKHRFRFWYRLRLPEPGEEDPVYPFDFLPTIERGVA
jgi:hypothetical protein